jgi:hypothetical protein
LNGFFLHASLVFLHASLVFLHASLVFLHASLVRAFFALTGQTAKPLTAPRNG